MGDTSTNFEIDDPGGGARIAGVAGSPGAAADTVLTSDGAGGTSWASGGGSVPGTVIPVADPTDATVDTTTYDNPITGSGKLKTIVFPGDTAAVGIALAGDDFPRVVMASDPSDGWYFGDGTTDPYSGVAYFHTVGSGAEAQLQIGGQKLSSTVDGSSLPTANPGPGLLWSDSGVITLGT